MMTMRLAASAFALAILSGCAGGLPMRGAEEAGVADGVFAGRLSYAEGPESCPRQMTLRLSVANGRAEGELRTDAARGFPVDGHLDTDGAFATRVRALGDIYALRGAFRGDGFSGRLQTESGIERARDAVRPGETNLRLGLPARGCIWTVRLSRQAG